MESRFRILFLMVPLFTLGLSGCAATKNLFGFGEEETPPPAEIIDGQVVEIALIPVLVAAGNIATNIVVTSVVDVETSGQMALAGRYTALVAEFGIFALLGLTAVLSLRAGWGEERSLPGS